MDLRLRLATSVDQALVEQYHDGFFDDISACIAKQTVYIAYQGEEIVGFGEYEMGWIRKDYVSIGMFVRPEYRRRGLGAQLLCALKELVRQNGKTPIASIAKFRGKQFGQIFYSGDILVGNDTYDDRQWYNNFEARKFLNKITLKALELLK